MSNDLNQFQCIGRLGKDPETRYMPNGEAVASFSVAVGSQWKTKDGEKKESTEWVNCSAFGKLAEIVQSYLHKGSQVYVSGRLKTDKYEKDGQTHYSTKVVVDRMQMLGGKPEGKPEGEPKSNHPGFNDMDSDIPF